MATEVRGEWRNVLATGALLAEQREHAGMTRTELAAKAETTGEALGTAEAVRGSVHQAWQTLVAIARSSDDPEGEE